MPVWVEIRKKMKAVRYSLTFRLLILLSAALAAWGEEPVMRIEGLCSDSGSAPVHSSRCAVSVSRQQFETLLGVLTPNRPGTPAMKEKFAKAYAELLAMESAARELGIDKSPEYLDTMRWVQAKTLADLLRHRLDQESAATDAEIEAYYREKAPEFEEARIHRLVLPKNSFSAVDHHKFIEDAKRVAGELREHAAEGEDLERMQLEGYAALGFTGLPPVTLVGPRRRRDLPPELSDEVFSLRPGGVSRVEEETYSFVIYKLEAKWLLPLEQVKEEIARELARSKMDRALKSIAAKIRTELNQDYFDREPEK
jgi:PPIC-type PPIASE domain